MFLLYHPVWGGEGFGRKDIASLCSFGTTVIVIVSMVITCRGPTGNSFSSVESGWIPPHPHSESDQELGLKLKIVTLASVKVTL